MVLRVRCDGARRNFRNRQDICEGCSEVRERTVVCIAGKSRLQAGVRRG